MRIAFVNYTPPEGSWPAIARSMSDALVRAGHELEHIGDLQVQRGLLWSARKAGHKLTGTDLHPERQQQVARGFAGQIRETIGARWPDLIFSTSSLPLACLEAPCPMVFWTDATFAGMLGFYKEFSRLSASTLRNGHRLERDALRRVSHAFYASHWAARSAVADHGADPARVHVAPFGPNLPEPPGDGHLEEWIAGRGRERCELLFIGYDWERKGGSRAVGVLRSLRARGVPATLTVIGCEPPWSVDTNGLQVIGRLDKNDPPQRRAIEHALAHSHFLLLPSRAECFGVVYCEASAFGVPSVACDVGGVADAVRDGVNGMLIPADATDEAIAARIAAAWSDPIQYGRLARSSREEYVGRLNWANSVRAILGHVGSEVVR